MNHYQLLGVPEDATKEQIRTAFREKIALVHPDKFAYAKETGANAAYRNHRFAALKKAHETLSDRRRRYEYDRSIRVPQGLADLLDLPQGRRAMARLLPRAPKQARDGEDLVAFVRVPPSTLFSGGVADPPAANA